MWTTENRPQYDRKGLRYPSDLTDAEWELVMPRIPAAKRGGRKREIVVRDVLNGILYVLSTACQWRALPKDLPPRSTVHGYLQRWDYDGTLMNIHDALYVACREKAQREARLHAIVHSADIQDRDGGGLVLNTLFGRFPFLTKLFADGGYQGPVFARAAAQAMPDLSVEIVKRSDTASGFEVLPKRWVVERSFGWFGRCRRLAKDFENHNRTAMAFLRLASVRLMLRRLCKHG
jgi:transposase